MGQVDDGSPADPGRSAHGRGHWDSFYQGRGAQRVSWFQADPARSIELIEDLAGGAVGGGVIDVGGGASRLASRLDD
jgi:hypothetical protein